MENDYVQLIGKNNTVNGITLTVDYVIADRRQVNVFYRVEGSFGAVYGHPHFLDGTEEELQEVIVSSYGSRLEPGQLQKATLDFVGNESTPSRLTFLLRVTRVEREGSSETAELAVGDRESTSGEEAILFEIPLELELDEAMTAQGEVYEPDLEIHLDGQRFLIRRVEICPSFLQVDVEADPGNTAWLKGLTFYAEDENGNRTEPITNGISALGDPDTPGMDSLRSESSFFWDSKSLTLHITEADWLDKDAKDVTVSLDGAILKGDLPADIRYLGGARRSGGQVELLFFGKQPGEPWEGYVTTFQIAGSFCTADGEEIFSGGRSSTTGVASLDGRDILVPEGYFADCYHLSDCPDGAVVVELNATRREERLKDPVSIPLK